MHFLDFEQTCVLFLEVETNASLEYVLPVTHPTTYIQPLTELSSPNPFSFCRQKLHTNLVFMHLHSIY